PAVSQLQPLRQISLIDADCVTLETEKRGHGNWKDMKLICGKTVARKNGWKECLWDWPTPTERTEPRKPTRMPSGPWFGKEARHLRS
ncbi:hypothetical protein Ddye_032661, partial [Dipteronia dyeriana]